MARTARPKLQTTLEKTLWEPADKLRGNQEPRENKHVVRGLVFSVRASMRSKVRRLLARYNYGPGAEAKAIELVLEQGELFAANGGRS